MVIGLLGAITAATLITNAAVVADETGTSGLIDPFSLALLVGGGLVALMGFVVLVSNAIR